MANPFGQDNACDPKTDFVQYITDVAAELSLASPRRVHFNEEQEEEEDFLQRSIPSFSTGTVVFGCQSALRNRLQNDLLLPDRKYDIERYKPIFVHDVLMFPGSLASLTSQQKGTSFDIVHRMTPALLPGFTAHVHPATLQPCVLPSSSPTDCFQGMLLLGHGRDSRRKIQAHYEPHCRRAKLEVQIDVVVSVPAAERTFARENFRLRRRRVWAYVWLWADASGVNASLRGRMVPWTLEGSIEGNLRPGEGGMEAEAAAWQSGGFVVSEVSTWQEKPEEKVEKASQDNPQEKSNEQPQEASWGAAEEVDSKPAEDFAGW